VPAAHVANGVHVPVLAVLKVPFAQFAQIVFEVGVPGVLGVVPAGQTDQALQLAAFSVELKVPVAQSPQVRLVVALPAVSTYLPATQLVKGTHGVAAEPSSSQVPTAQAVAGLLPPLQEVPAAHAAQTGGALLVAGAVS
jgi:hypothetical protein